MVYFSELKITELKYLVECAIHHTKYSEFQSALKLLLEARSLYQVSWIQEWEKLLNTLESNKISQLFLNSKYWFKNQVLSVFLA